MNYGLPLYKVNTATLGLYAEYPFFGNSCINLKVDIAMRYNLNGTHKGMFGHGWQFAYESGISFNDKRLHLKKGTGQVLSFELKADTSLSGSAYNELVPVGPNQGRMLEYSNYYLYEDGQSGHLYKYAKKKQGTICNLSQVSDYCGNALKFHYGPDNSIQEVVDPFDRVIRFIYTDTYCTGIFLPDGREASIAYSKGKVSKITNLAGAPIEFHYDDKQRLKEMKVGKKMKSTGFSYTEYKGNSILQTVTDRNGSVTRYDLLSHDPVKVKVTDPSGFSRIIISRNGLTENIIDSDGRNIEYQYRNGLPVSITDKNGSRQYAEYDLRGRMVQRTDKEGNSEKFTYDDSGNLTSHTDALGRKTGFVYDDRRNIIRMELPDGTITTYQYGERGCLYKVMLPNGNTEYYEYDAFSNLTAVRDNIGYTYKTKYDDFGYQLCEYIDAMGSSTGIKSDELDRVKEIKYADGTAKTYEYDCCAGIVTRDQLGGTWLFERDPMSRIVKKIDPSGRIRGYQFDAAGQKICEMDELGRKSIFEYDGNGNVVKSINAMGGAVVKKRNANGRPIEIIDENENSFTFEYNRNNLVRTITDPLGNKTVYGYNSVNRQSFVITPGKHKISFVYDNNDNIIKKLVDDIPVSELSYNVSGDIVKVEDNTGVTEYAYDLRGRMTGAVFGNREQISVSYDLLDRIEQMVYPNGLNVRYFYDSMGRISSICWGNQKISIAYDNMGRPVTERRSNSSESRYDYDGCHRTVKIDHSSQEGAFAGTKLKYDLAGNLIEEAYYNPMLDSSAEEAAFTDVSIRYNKLNQLVQSNHDECRYDPDGNMTERVGNNAASFVYDAENRLVEKNNAQGKTEYTYNTLNQLVKIKRKDKTTFRFFDLSDRLLFEKDESGETKSHIYCHRQLAATVYSDGSIYYYHYDHRGNTIAITNEVGLQVAAYSYLPYGAIRKKMEKYTGNCFTFLGAYGVIDEQDGYYIMPNRCYDSVAGRFLQQDPLGFVDGQNLYSYANGNPLTRIDPEGTIIWLIPVAIIGGGYVAYKAVSAAKNFGRDISKIDSEKLNKAAKILDQYTKAFAAGRIDENLYWRARDNYTRLLNQVNNQAAQAAKTGVYEYGINTRPAGELGDIIKDITCSPP